MKRFLALFAVMLVICLALMWGMMAQNGYDLFAPEMSGMLVVAVLVAAYVAFRISRILEKRSQRAHDGSTLKGAQQSKLSGLFSSTSPAQQAREARVAARRKQLIAEGKLEDETPAEPEISPVAEGEVPTRVPQSASVKDRMDARRERYRRAKEEGKI
jgi:type VI protein secretion system component VasK